MVHQERDQRPEQQAEGGGGKGAKRKALQHFIHGDEQAAEAEPDDHAQNGTVLLADEPGSLADREARDNAQAEE